jgi:hypothetical protein
VALLTEAQRAFTRYGVMPGALRWTGRPPTGLRLRRADVFIIPFSLMWGGFAIFWEAMVVRGGAPFFFKLWGIPFVAAGLYIMVGRFFWDSYRRGGTCYGVTADSALIVRKGIGGAIQRLYLPAITTLGLDLKADGRGTILFGDPASSRWTWNWSGASPVPAFEEIPDAQRVYELCADAQRIARETVATPVP